MSQEKKSSVLSNLSWKFAERISAQLVTTIVSIVLARILEPSHYGIIAIVTIFITLANVFVSDGFGSALIQKKDVDALDFSSVLYFNIAFSILLYFGLFFSAPLITRFFGSEYDELTSVIRVLGLRIILSAINSVQQAYVAKKMIFKKFFGATLTGTIISAVVGIYMAYAGFGVWALVAQYLTNTTIDTVFLSFSLHKLPLLKFSIKRLKSLVGFGAKVLGANLLITGYQEIRAIIIGKFYSSEDLAFYKKAGQFPDLLTTNINSSVSSVLFPSFSSMQDNDAEMKALAKKSITLSFYITSPLLIGLASISNIFVPVLLTDKWNACIPYLILLCFNNLFFTINSTNMQIIKAKGRSDISLKIEIIKKVVEVVLLIVSCQFGVIWIVVAMVFTSTLFTIVNCIPTKKLIGYSFFEQFRDILSTLILSLTMGGIVYFLGFINVNKIFLLFAQVLVGAIYYIGLSFLFKKEELHYIIKKIKKI